MYASFYATPELHDTLFQIHPVFSVLQFNFDKFFNWMIEVLQSDMRGFQPTSSEDMPKLSESQIALRGSPLHGKPKSKPIAINAFQEDDNTYRVEIGIAGIETEYVEKLQTILSGSKGMKSIHYAHQRQVKQEGHTISIFYTHLDAFYELAQEISQELYGSKMQIANSN